MISSTKRCHIGSVSSAARDALLTEGEGGMIIFAIVGPIVGVAGLLFSMYKFVLDRPKLKIESGAGLVTWDRGEHWHTFVKAINIGRRDEIVDSIGFKSETNKVVLLVSPKNYPEGMPPRKLSPGDAMTAVIPGLELHEQWAANDLGRMTEVIVQTKRGHTYSTAPRGDIADQARLGYHLDRNGNKVLLD